MTETITLDGHSLTIEQLVRIARDASVRVAIDPSCEERVAASEQLIARVVANYRRAWEAGEPAATEYGVTTGFGEFKDKPIAPADLEQLQRNLLLSHSVGVGENCDPDDLSNYFPADVVRAVLATRLNSFLQGHSGVRRKLVAILQAMLDRGVIPLVPLRGSVGASGDLCPLSHTFATLLGSGRFYIAGDKTLRDASELPELLGFTADDLKPTFKEGLALVNGVNFSASMLAFGVADAERLADLADASAALTLEAMGGCTRALDPKVHDARGHAGQIASAARMRELIAGSKLVERAGAVQDPYSLRCAPQVHGASRAAIRYARDVAEREINAATDNPLFFPGESEPFDVQFRDNWPPDYRGDERLAYSAGNFHGQPIALAADFLSIALAELANISERRTQMLLDSDHNRGLPSNLTTRPGVNSGLMIMQYTAASLVSENKVLAHPASVDSIPTGANAEDHVSMSTHAARKMRTILGNAQSVLAIELIVAAQAIDWRVAMMQGVPEAHNIADAETQATAFEAAVSGRAAEIAKLLGHGTADHYLRIRALVDPLFADRPLNEAIRRVKLGILI
ncbi:MAG TPA: histidine ammonia-lyase [Thermoanaerobaculia bacterium]|jgi:histidine ammonia-lyase|nr:histidine ammonia-lyase [Thermoanaerobaculia bacterium]